MNVVSISFGIAPLGLIRNSFESMSRFIAVTRLRTGERLIQPHRSGKSPWIASMFLGLGLPALIRAIV